MKRHVHDRLSHSLAPVAALVAACSAPPNDRPPPAKAEPPCVEPAGHWRPQRAEPAATLPLPAGVAFSLTLPRRAVRVGDSAAIQFILRNTTPDQVRVTLTGSLAHAFDALVTDSTGSEVWRRHHGGDIDLNGLILPLDGGDSLAVPISWDLRSNTGHPVPAGRYCVSGYLELHRTGDPGTPPVPLVILPR